VHVRNAVVIPAWSSPAEPSLFFLFEKERKKKKKSNVGYKKMGWLAAFHIVKTRT
jgi:hypothetical protein